MNYARTISLLLIAILAASSAAAAPPDQVEGKGEFPRSVAALNIDYQTYIDANPLLMFVTNQGSFAYDNDAILGKTAGLYYPKGTNLTAIYAAGLWLGGKVGTDLRVSLAEYWHSYWPGPMVDGSFVPDANADPQYRVYKILREMQDNGFYDSPRPTGDPALERLWDDFHQWPSAQGAPVDGSGDPKFIGDQTLWSVYNDANPVVRDNSAGTPIGLGVEVQQTSFAFDRPGPLGHCIFQRYVLINKSGTPIDDLIVSFWADPDLGQMTDDYVGCDSVLNIGYVYNATNSDAKYGATPPAVGFCVLQGPAWPSLIPEDSAFFFGEWHHGFNNLPMTAFSKFINGTDPDTPQETYWYMQGLGAKNGGAPVVDPTNSAVTTYMVNGDPFLGTGWLDCCTRIDTIISANIDILEIAGPGGVILDPPADVACQWNSTNEFNVTSDQECNLARMNWRGLIGTDSWEFRFTAGGSEYYDWVTEQKFSNRAPFEVWNIGSGTPDDPSDDRRVQFFIIDDDESDSWTPGDRTYISEREYYEPLPQIAEYTWPDDLHIGRIVFNGGIPQDGTVVRFVAGDPDTTYDELSSDCRYLVSTGPFNMAAGDTQEVVMAVVAGRGTDRLSSVNAMKSAIPAAKDILYSGFDLCDCSGIGDCSGDGQFNLVDIVYLINYALFNGVPPPSDENCPVINFGDFNCDGSINLVDLVLMVNYVYRQPAPGPCDPCAR